MKNFNNTLFNQEQSNLVIHPNKILLSQYQPYKNMNSTYRQHFQTKDVFNFNLYERTKKNKKLDRIKHKKDIKLFLEGEEFMTSKQLFKTFQEKNKQTLTQKILRPFQRKSAQTIQKDSMFSKKPPFIGKQSVRKLITFRPINSNFNKINQQSSGNQSIINTFNKKPIKVLMNKQIKKQISSTASNNKIEATLALSQRPLFVLNTQSLSQISAQSFIVVESDSREILTANCYKKIGEIASLTKIMTFHAIYNLSLEKDIKLDETYVTIDEDAQEMSGTTAEIIAGDYLTIEQLLYGLMLPSGNDAAIALAKWGGSLLQTLEQNQVNKFVKYMNKVAQKIGMKSSVFGNPHGLPNSKNISNCEDLAILICFCLKIPLFQKIVQTKVLNLWIENSGVKKELIWQNTNKLLRRQGFMGVKTGVTVTAGPCLATCYQHEGKTFIVVLLRAAKLSRRFKETRLILGWSLKKYNDLLYGVAAAKMLKHNVVLDSDNSEDEQVFIYDKVDAQEMGRRNKILANQL